MMANSFRIEPANPERHTQAIAPNRLKAYLRKYRQGIKDIGMTAASFQADYSLAILVTPLTLRGM
jgi:hypothetical protein